MNIGVNVAVLVLVGAANPVVDINLDTIVQRLTPEHRMARVFGALDTCYVTTQALGSLAMVPLLALLGVQWALVVIAVPVTVMALLSLGRMRRMDAHLRAPESLALLRRIPWFASLTPRNARNAGPLTDPSGRSSRHRHHPAGQTG